MNEKLETKLSNILSPVDSGEPLKYLKNSLVVE